MIGLLLAGAGVERLGIQHLLYGQLVVIPGPTARAPAKEALFRLALHGRGTMIVPSHALSGSSISACIKRQKTRKFARLPAVRCQMALGQSTQAVFGNLPHCRKVGLG